MLSQRHNSALSQAPKNLFGRRACAGLVAYCPAFGNGDHPHYGL